MLLDQFLKDPFYRLSKIGNLYTCRIPHTELVGPWRLGGYTDKNGYRVVNYKQKKLFVHRLVFYKFKGRLSSDMVVDHIDGNKKNNHPKNLQQITAVANILKFYSSTGGHIGNRFSRTLPESTIKGVLADRECGLSYGKLACKYGISKSHAHYIVNTGYRDLKSA